MGHTACFASTQPGTAEKSLFPNPAPSRSPVCVVTSLMTVVHENGRVFTDDVIDHRLAFLSKGEIPPDGLKPHTDLLKAFPYIGTPHPKKS